VKISGWGRYPVIDAEGEGFETREELAALLGRPGRMIPYGRGRSYGDSALAERIVFNRRFDKLLGFDSETGLLHCESGMTLQEIIDIFLPRGWFLPVTPGTRFITVGGAVASDVHGKNHHKVGCFTRFVDEFGLMGADGRELRCSRSENPELFRATCGGMGLTGVILDVVLRLQPIQSAYIRETVLRCRNLDEVCEAFERHAETSYSVAWIDCLAKGSRVGRSVLMLGEHAAAGRRWLERDPVRTVPVDLPGFCLNRYSVALFNRAYYRSHPKRVEGRLVPMDRFFYPLDRIGAWNRMYGRKGFTQYQLVLPKADGRRGLTEILSRISEAGLGSFLGVLKLFGPENDNFLSFPMEGYTLALDFKIEKRLFAFLDELDRIVLDYGGRLYLTKDVRMEAAVFRRGYPRWRRFADLRRQMGLDTKFSSRQSERLRI
jgi:FAD/FMN-containing dehydrogenase